MSDLQAALLVIAILVVGLLISWRMNRLALKSGRARV